MRLKHCMVTSNVEYFSGNIQDIVKSKNSVKKWAYILHDKDPDTSPHYHIYLNFGKTSVDTKDIGNWFGLQESQVEPIKARGADAYLYLVHGNDSAQSKHQYDLKEVVANFDFENEIKVSKILGDFAHFSYAQQLQYINTLPISEKAPAYNKLETLWKLHCKCLTLNADRNIDVMFIYGKPGAGKTYYAKKFADSHGYDFCISSSSNDIWQDYMGQNVMILDDLRDEDMKFTDLLKNLDNDTSSSTKSRFSNKVFNGKLIIITASIPLSYWYRELQYVGASESLNQLYRRITCYVEVTKEFVSVYEGNDGQGNTIDVLDIRGRPQGVASVFKNELQFIDKKKTQKTNFGEAFSKMLEPVMPLEFFNKPKE